MQVSKYLFTRAYSDLRSNSVPPFSSDHIFCRAFLSFTIILTTRTHAHTHAQAIVKHVPPPVVRSEGAFSMLVTSVEYDNYVGKVWG